MLMNSEVNFPPETLYKYLSIRRAYDFIKHPSISFSMIKMFPDDRECFCSSILNQRITQQLIRETHLKSNYGILCLTEDGNSNKMWYDYADNAQGIQIAFNIYHPFFYLDGAGWSKITYTDKEPVLPQYYEALYSKFYCIEQLKYAMRRKDAKWSYEKEWRSFCIIENLEDIRKGYKKIFLPKRKLNFIIKYISVGSNTNYKLKNQCSSFCVNNNIKMI